MNSAEKASSAVEAIVRGENRAHRRRDSAYARSLLKTSALSSLALVLMLPGAQAGQGDLWQPQVRAIVGVENERGNAALEAFVPLKQTSESVLFLDVRAKHDFDDGFGQDIGLGVRRIVDPDLMLGGYAYVNVLNRDGHHFTGATLGLEAVATSYDAHVNVFVPLSGDDTTRTASSSLSLVGNQLLEAVSTLDRRNYAAWGIEGEFGLRLPVGLPDDQSLRLSVGGYHFADPDGGDDSITGAKAGLEFAIDDVFGSGASLALAGEVRDDNRFGTQFAGSVRLSVPFNPPASTGEAEDRVAYPAGRSLRRRVNERVRGDIGVRVLTQTTTRTSSSVAVDAATGAAFRDFFFADGDNTLGLGTVGDPTTLDDAVARADRGGFVVALGGKGDITTAGAVLLDGQSVLGGGQSVAVRTLGGAGPVVQFAFRGTDGTMHGTAVGNPVLSLANGNNLRGITVTGGATGVFGHNIAGATLTGVTVSGAAGSGIVLDGSSTGITASNLVSKGNAGDGLHIASDGTFSFAGTTALSGNGDDGLDISGKGTYAFATLDALANGDDGIRVSGTAVGGTFTTAGGTVSGNGGTGVFIDPITAKVVLDSISQSGGVSGIVLDHVSGSFAVAGATTIADTTGPGIAVSDSPASIRFGDVEIDRPGGDGMSFAGVNASVTAGGIVVSGLGAGMTGIDFSGADTVFSARSATISGGGAGSIGIDLAGSLAGSAIAFTGGGSISGVGTGVRLGIAGSLAGSADADFTFGGGSVGGTLAALDARGLNGTRGHYRFAATDFAGAQLFDVQHLLFVGAAASGAGDGSSIADLTTIGAADAVTGATTTFVLVNRGIIDDADGFTLGDGQSMVSFGDGNSVWLSGVPLNVVGDNVQNGAVLTDAAGAATLTSSAGATTITLANNTTLAHVDVANANPVGGVVVGASGVTGVALDGVAIGGGTTGFAGIDVGAKLTKVTVSGAGGHGIVFNGASAVSASNLTSKDNSGSGLLIAGDGSYDFTGTTLLSGNGSAGLGVIGNSTVAFQTLNALDNAAVGVGALSPGGVGKLSIGGGTISGNGEASLFLWGQALDVTLDSISQDGGDVGASLAGASGNFTVTGATSIKNLSSGGLGGLMFAGNSAAIRFGGPVDIENVAAGGGILVNVSSGRVDFDGSVTVTNADVTGIQVTDNTAPVTFGGLVTVDKSNDVGILIGGNDGAVTFGDVAIEEAGYDALQLLHNAGAVSFGDVAIDRPAGFGIDVEDLNGTIAFGNIDITDLCDCATGLNLAGSTSVFTATSLDISGVAGGGSFGIDLSGTSGGSVTIGSGVIESVDYGVVMGTFGLAGTSANTTFSFGGGSITGAVASVDRRGLAPGSGTYDFHGTTLNGPQL